MELILEELKKNAINLDKVKKMVMLNSINKHVKAITNANHKKSEGE